MTERQLDGKTEQSNDPAGPWGKTIHMHQYVGQQEPGEVDGPRGGPEEAKESERATHVRKTLKKCNVNQNKQIKSHLQDNGKSGMQKVSPSRGC